MLKYPTTFEESFFFFCLRVYHVMKQSKTTNSLCHLQMTSKTTHTQVRLQTPTTILKRYQRNHSPYIYVWMTPRLHYPKKHILLSILQIMISQGYWYKAKGNSAYKSQRTNWACTVGVGRTTAILKTHRYTWNVTWDPDPMLIKQQTIYCWGRSLNIQQASDWQMEI